MVKSNAVSTSPQAVSTAPSASRKWQFIGLNVVRGLSLVGLTLLFVSSIVTIANDIKAVNAFVEAEKNHTACQEGNCDYVTNSTVPNQAAGAFWAVLNRLLVVFQAIVLIMSEVGWPAKFFDRFFPILGMDFGLGALGIIQCLLGAAVLSHHVDKFSLVSAFFVFAIGCLNMLLGLIYREQARPVRSIRGWRQEKKDVLPSVRPAGSAPAAAVVSEKEQEARLGTTRSDSTKSSRSGMGFGRQGQKAAEAQGFHIREPEESVPPYAPKPREPKQATSPTQ